MVRYKHYDYNQLMMVPVSLEEQLMPGTLEHAINIKIVLFGYLRGLISSRSLERACRENITFMALAGGQMPDYSTIAAFVSSMDKEIEPLFTKVLLICEEEELLGGTHFSLDGLKLSSNAAKEWSGTFADLKKKQEALERKVKEAICEHREADKRECGKSGSARQPREKRIKRLKQKADRIEKFLAENKPKIGSSGKEIQSNVTDNDSARLTSSHGVLQGYNANAIVDVKHQIVVHAAAFGKGEGEES